MIIILGICEQLNNADFNPLEFEGYLKEAGSNAFTLSPLKWQKTTNAVGLFVKLGRYGGTYAHKDIAFKYASEADMLNVALFDKRAKQWREENPDLKGNMRDCASLNELLVLANMESYNAILIGKGLEQKERMIELRNLAKTQLIFLEKLNQLDIKKFSN